MVILLITALFVHAEFLLPIDATLHPVKTGHRLAMEFPRRHYYVGERFSVDFVLYSDVPFEEVEVARFPEFDGFWSENVALRQGRLILSRSRPGPYRIVLGSYNLMSWLRPESPRIEPMHLILKNRGQRLVSQGAMPKFLPLPPPLPDTTAVGMFSVQYSQSQNFSADEPLAIRITVQGEGNFPEIDIPNPVLPQHAELASRRSFLSGNSQYASKTFEYTYLIHSATPSTLPAITFHYFNPRERRYQSVPIGPIHLIPVTQSSATVPRQRATSNPPFTHSRSAPTVRMVALFAAIFTTVFGAGLLWRRSRPSSPNAATTTRAPATENKDDERKGEIRSDWQTRFDEAINARDQAAAARSLLDAIEEAADFHPDIVLLHRACQSYLYAPEKPHDFDPSELRRRFLESKKKRTG